MSHCEVEGASYGSEKGLAIANDVTIPLPLLQDKRLSYVALGHIHKHQVLGKNPLIVYSGSPQRIDFGEEKEEKGICLVEIIKMDNGQWTMDNAKKKNSQLSIFNSQFTFIPTNARQFLTITVNLTGNDPNPTQTILSEIKNNGIEDKIVRVVINIPKECDKEIQMDQIKKALSSANFIAGISKNIERVERVKFDGSEQVETLTPLQALRKYFEFKKYSPQQQKELEKAAAQILES